MAAEKKKKFIMRRVDLANSETEQDILIKEARSDGAAFAELYRMHYEKVFRYCFRRLFNRHAAEDVTSTVFFRVMKKIHQFKGDSKDFRNWVYKIATNAVNDYLRMAKKQADTFKLVANEHQGDHLSGTGPDNESGEINLQIKQALLQLKPKHQTVITLHYFEKMKLTEIAEILGKNPATIRSQLSRALSKLRKTLEAAGRENREVLR